MTRLTHRIYVALLASIIMFSCNSPEENTNGTEKDVSGDVAIFTTYANRSMLFQKSSADFNDSPNMDIAKTVWIEPGEQFQQIDGFGVAITGSSCYNLLRMKQEDRTALLNECFSPDQGLGFSYIRISIGCSDFSLEEYTCCDIPGIENFDIHELDRRDLFPILKEILAINPQLKIMASPWTCPRWMKVDNLTDLQPFNSWTSGQLDPEYYQDYATYFVKFIQEMENEGFPIESVTIQNEPLNRGNSVSLYMSWQEQASFIKSALGPAFEANGITSKIVVFDHNYNYDNIADQQGYPIHIYEDPETAAYVDGAAYHAYGGNKSELQRVHQAYPGKNLYFTEMSIGSWDYSFDSNLLWSMKEIGIGTLNNYSKAVIVWNFLLDENGAPNRPGGCTTCYGSIEISSKDYATLDRKTHYYLIAHLSKVITPGSTRIGFSGYTPEGLHLTAAKNLDGSVGTVLLNDTDQAIKLTLDDGTNSFPLTVAPRSISSCRWALQEESK